MTPSDLPTPSEGRAQLVRLRRYWCLSEAAVIRAFMATAAAHPEELEDYLRQERVLRGLQGNRASLGAARTSRPATKAGHRRLHRYR